MHNLMLENNNDYFDEKTSKISKKTKTLIH